MARSAGIDGVRVDKAADLGVALEQAIKLNKPYLIDANIGADMNPGGAGVWELPGLGHKQPAIGGRCNPY
jgi:acetolactate synthase-1/2/3 large subunit